MSDNAIDPNQIAALLLKDGITSLITGCRSFVDGAVLGRLQRRLEQQYSSYLQVVRSRAMAVRTFAAPRDSTTMQDIYVPLDVRAGEKQVLIPNATLQDIEAHGNRFTVIGTGGSGKSTLFKSLLLQALDAPRRIPITLDLRDLALESTLTIYLSETLRQAGIIESQRDFEAFLNAGNCVLFLDGFDELSESGRAPFLRAANDFAHCWPLVTIFVSSRPSDSINSLTGFGTLDVCPLSLSKATALIARSSFGDDSTKTTFIAALANGLFVEKQSFASNPLLLQVMLLTFANEGDIDDKLHLFLNSAFMALWNRHDAQKSSFRRPRKAQLQLGTNSRLLASDEFQRILSSYSLRTYSTSQFSTSLIDAGDICHRSIKDHDYSVDTDAYLEDLCESTCILWKDHLRYHYLHRSFQEYFAALRLRSLPSSARLAAAIPLLFRARTDSMFSLLFQMERDVFEAELLLPLLENYLTDGREH